MYRHIAACAYQLVTVHVPMFHQVHVQHASTGTGQESVIVAACTQASCAWAPAGIIPEGGKTEWTDKNDLFSGAPKAQTKIFAMFSAF